MNLHTGISLFLLFSSVIYGGITGFTNPVLGLSILSASLYAFNIHTENSKSAQISIEAKELILDSIQKLDDRIIFNRENTEVIIKEVEAKINETNTKMGQIHLTASNVKTQNATGAAKYRF